MGDGAGDRRKSEAQGFDGRLMKTIECCETDLNEAVERCVKLSMEGAGELGIEHWVGEPGDRPFPTTDKISYRNLLDFVTRNRDRISNSRDFLHYMTPWYEWALFTAESKIVGSLLAGSHSADQRNGLVKQIRDYVMQMDAVAEGH